MGFQVEDCRHLSEPSQVQGGSKAQGDLILAFMRKRSKAMRKPSARRYG